MREILRNFPVDISVVILLSVVGSISMLFLPAAGFFWVVRLGIGIFFLLFLPGYTVVAALFPRADTESTSNSEHESRLLMLDPRSSISRVERVLYSVGVSIAIVPLIGIGLDRFVGSLSPAVITLVISVFTVCTAVIAAKRRINVPMNERFSIPIPRFRAVRAGMVPTSNFDWVRKTILVVAIVVATSSVGYAVTDDGQQRNTEFYLLTESEGELVAGQYPTELEVEEEREVVVGITNNGYQPREFTVVVLLQEYQDGDQRATTVREVARFSEEIEANSSWHRLTALSSPVTGRSLRFDFLLYEGQVPENPSPDNADMTLHLQTNVTE